MRYSTRATIICYVTCNAICVKISHHRHFLTPDKVNFNRRVLIKYRKDRGNLNAQRSLHDDVVSVFIKAVVLMDVMNNIIA